MTTFDEMKVATEIVAAFTSHNSLRASELPSLIEAIHAAVTRLAGPDEATDVIDPPAPAVSIRKSVTPDYLICLEDGKRFKSMRRHLALLGMTPEQYRAKWSLPSTYPMVAANYAAQRSAWRRPSGWAESCSRQRENPRPEPKPGVKGLRLCRRLRRDASLAGRAWRQLKLSRRRKGRKLALDVRANYMIITFIICNLCVSRRRQPRTARYEADRGAISGVDSVEL